MGLYENYLFIDFWNYWARGTSLFLELLSSLKTQTVSRLEFPKGAFTGHSGKCEKFANSCINTTNLHICQVKIPVCWLFGCYHNPFGVRAFADSTLDTASYSKGLLTVSFFNKRKSRCTPFTSAIVWKYRTRAWHQWQLFTCKMRWVAERVGENRDFTLWVQFVANSLPVLLRHLQRLTGRE